MRDLRSRVEALEAARKARRQRYEHRCFIQLHPSTRDPEWRVKYGLPADPAHFVFDSFEEAKASNVGPVVCYYGPALTTTETEESEPESTP